MATQTREINTEKNTEKNTENSAPPASNPSAEGPPHPLASVLGSFRDDLATLDAIMAGVEKYRQQMELEEYPSK